MVKLLLRCTERELPTKKQVYDIMMGEIQACLTGLREIGSGYHAYFDMERDMDKVLTQKGKEALSKISLEVKLPPKMKAKRSVICRKIDNYVGEKTKEELKQEIESKNSRLKVEEIIKFKHHTHVFKIIFTSTEMAEIVKREGILCFNMKISNTQIEQEEFIDLLLCFHCYTWEKHSTRECPNGSYERRCSECAGQHDYRECKSTHKQCLNCGGQHRTMSMACPEKRKAMSEKKDKDTENKTLKEHQTYSKVVRQTLDSVTQLNTENSNTGNMFKSSLNHDGCSLT